MKLKLVTVKKLNHFLSGNHHQSPRLRKIIDGLEAYLSNLKLRISLKHSIYTTVKMWRVTTPFKFKVNYTACIFDMHASYVLTNDGRTKYFNKKVIKTRWQWPVTISKLNSTKLRLSKMHSLPGAHHGNDDKGLDKQFLSSNLHVKYTLRLLIIHENLN